MSAFFLMRPLRAWIALRGPRFSGHDHAATPSHNAHSLLLAHQTSTTAFHSHCIRFWHSPTSTGDMAEEGGGRNSPLYGEGTVRRSIEERTLPSRAARDPS